MTWLKRLFCSHLNWVEGKPIGDFSPSIEEWLGMRTYHCAKCGKVKHYRFGDAPINYDITER